MKLSIQTNKNIKDIPYQCKGRFVIDFIINILIQKDIIIIITGKTLKYFTKFEYLSHSLIQHA